jgi:hypothetical protein
MTASGSTWIAFIDAWGKLRGVSRLLLVFLLAATCASGAEKDTVVVDAETEGVIAGALRWLAANQAPNGSWTARGGRTRGEHPIAMTGYTLIAYMAAGNLPEEGEYKKEVNAGMNFLLDQMNPDGEFRGVDGGRYMYNHGIATIALSELYGQSQNPALRVKLERAIKLILESQATQGEHAGGWRYQPRPGDADISITVLQVVALRSAKNGGLAVPQRTIDDAIAYVKRCQDPRSGGFSYQAGRRDAGFARTAAAIYSLQVCGLYDDPMVDAGARFLFNNANPNQQWWTYGCNYAAPAMYMIGGDSWRGWYALQREQLLRSVKRQGDQCFWDGEVGNVYCTAAHATILAMPWHYLPLYQR